MNQVIRTLALIGIIGAIAHIGSITYGYIDPNTNLTFTVNTVLYALIFLGITSAYLAQAKDLGRFGLFSFIVLSIGFILASGMGWAVAFARPVLVSLDPTFAINSPDVMPSPLIEGMASSFLTLNLGLLLFGFSLLKSSKISRWPGLLLIIAIAANFAPPMDDKAWYFINIAIIWICWKIRTRTAPAVLESSAGE